jgi:glutamate transport system substrate-binding protein
MGDSGQVGHRAEQRGKGVWPWVTAVIVLAVVTVCAIVGLMAIQSSRVPSKQELLVQAGLYGKPRLTIGVRNDIPGVAKCLAEGTTCEGFDIEIARAVGRELGFTPDKIDLIPIEIEARSTMQAYKPGSGYIKVDLVVASYSITPDRINKQGVVFSSAYLTTFQAVLTRQDFKGPLEGMPDLKGKKVCTLGATTAEEPLRRLGIIADARFRISDCVQGLKDGIYDAVQSDAAILAGFYQDDPRVLKIHDITMETPERWGIHTGKNAAVHKLVELALSHIVDDGEWSAIFSKYLAPAQQVIGQGQQIAIADPPEIPKPEIRE